MISRMKMRNNRRIFSLSCHSTALLALLVVTGCIARPSPVQLVTLYTLTYDPPVTQEAKKNINIVIAVKRLNAESIYATNKIYYAPDKYSRKTYGCCKWASYPNEMMTSLLIRDLSASGIAGAVIPWDASDTPAFVISGSIVEFLESRTSNPHTADAALRLNLYKVDEGMIKELVFSKTYRYSVPVEARGPEGLCAAMSKAVRNINNKFISDVDSVLAGLAKTRKHIKVTP